MNPLRAYNILYRPHVYRHNTIFNKKPLYLHFIRDDIRSFKWVNIIEDRILSRQGGSFEIYVRERSHALILLK